MLFTSYEFIGFLAIVLGAYYCIPKKWQWPFLLIASYAFYYIANPVYLIYIAVTTLSTWYVSLMMQRRKDIFADQYALAQKGMDRAQKKEAKEKEHLGDFDEDEFMALAIRRSYKDKKQ